jgi:two-component system sensor histidine kinase/response regulator
MNDHISKPIDPRMMFETIGRFYKSPTLESKPEPHSPQPEDLPLVEGLDTKDGLARVAGNRKLYLKLLRQFVEQQGAAVTDVSKALAAGDFPTAERLAHTLKGVAGNIGAKAVHGSAGELERVIRNRSGAVELDSAKNAVASALDPLISRLRTVAVSAAPESQPAPVATDSARVSALAAELARLLAECDPGSVDFVETNRGPLQLLFAGQTWGEFEKLVQGYSFDEARAQLEKALKQHSLA